MRQANSGDDDGQDDLQAGDGCRHRERDHQRAEHYRRDQHHQQTIEQQPVPAGLWENDG